MIMNAHVCATFVALLLAAAVPGCGDKSDGQQPRGPGPDNGPNPAGSPTPNPGAPQDPTTPLTGALQISGVDGFGLGQKPSAGLTALNLAAATETVLVALKADGSLSEQILPATPDYDPEDDVRPEIKQVLQLGQSGVLIQFNDFRYFRHTNALWIRQDGTLSAFAPEGFTPSRQFELEKIERDLDGKIWILGSDSLYSFDAVTTTFSRYTDPSLTIRDFTLTSDSQLFVYGVTQGNAGFLRRLLANGGFEEITTSDTQSGSGVALGRHLLNGDTLFSVSDSGLTSFYLPSEPGFLLRDSRGKNVTLPFVGGKWLLSYTKTDLNGDPDPRAFNILTQKISANPLAPSRSGARHARMGNGVVFDGVNTTTLTAAEASSGSGQTLQIGTGETRPLRRAGTTPIRPVRAFGNLHGFVGGYRVLGRTALSQSLWVADGESATGLLNHLTRLTLSEGQPTASDIENYGHLLKLGDGRTYLLVGNDSADSLYVFSSEPGTAGVSEITLSPVSLTGYGAGNDEYAHSVVVHDGALYVGRRNGVFKFHPTSGSESIDLLRPSEPTNGSCLSSVIELSLTSGSPQRPIALRRGCGQFGQTSDELEVLVYSSFDFSSVTSALTLALTATQTGEASFDTFNLPRLIDLASNLGGHQLLNLPKLGKARLLVWNAQNSSFSLGAEANISSVATEGNRPFAREFRSSARIDLAAPWSGEAFFLTGVTSDQVRQSYRIDLASDSETLLSELTGVEVYAALPGLKNTFWVSGNRIATNTNLVMRFDTDGTLVGQSAESGLQILQLAPFGDEE